VRSAEQLVEQLDRGETGTETYEIASDEDMSVMEVAVILQDVASEERGVDVDVELVENPRSDKTIVEEFRVDISAAWERLGWETTKSVATTVKGLVWGNTG
jgi:UDP-glucose 4-epimerase